MLRIDYVIRRAAFSLITLAAVLIFNFANLFESLSSTAFWRAETARGDWPARW